MKKLLKYSCLLLIALMSACREDFLDRQPLDVLSTTGNLASTNELRLYLNQFYQNLPSHPDFLTNFYDTDSDNVLATNINTRIDGKLSVSNATPLTEYTSIRGVNYFLANYRNATGDPTAINQYVGEARFFRAWFYYELVRKYGDVTWVNRVLPLDQEAVQVPRDPRTMVVDSILADLDQAVTLLPVQANSASQRVHRDVALAFKSRVALFEGTWQKYHRTKDDAFFTKSITDNKIRSYLNQAITAAQAVMTSGRWAITTTGNPLTDYNNLFITRDLSANREVMLWRKYNVGENIGHGFSRYLGTAGGDLGATLSLVDDYLTRQGKPFVGAERTTAQSTYGRELQPDLRDPRLSQTIAVPGKPLRPNVTVSPFPPINLTGFSRSTTGYPFYKYLEYDNGPATQDGNFSSAPLILFRYAEVLLNYAEAVAEMGDDPNLIKTALKPLRDRVGMPAVDFEREYISSPGYPFASLSKELQSIRRERRVEMVVEGTRLYDILRWAAADVLLVGKRPLGALYIGSDLATQNTSTGAFRDALLYFDTPPAGRTINFYLTGSPGDARRYIDPYKPVLPIGYRFNVNRDYLLPIQDRLIQLTGGTWTQNPGW